MPVDPGGITRGVVTILGTDSSSALNIFHAQNNSGVTKTDTDTLDDWKAYLDSVYNDPVVDISDTATISPYEIFLIDGVTGDSTPIGTRSPALQPIHNSELLPHGVAALINADLSGTGRGSGKKFFPYYAENSSGDGLWVTTTLTRLALAAAAYLLDFGGVSGSDWGTGTWTQLKGFRDLVSAVARDIPAYQRRRKPGVGI